MNIAMCGKMATNEGKNDLCRKEYGQKRKQS